MKEKACTTTLLMSFWWLFQPNVDCQQPLACRMDGSRTRCTIPPCCDLYEATERAPRSQLYTHVQRSTCLYGPPKCIQRTGLSTTLSYRISSLNLWSDGSLALASWFFPDGDCGRITADIYHPEGTLGGSSTNPPLKVNEPRGTAKNGESLATSICIGSVSPLD